MAARRTRWMVLAALLPLAACGGGDAEPEAEVQAEAPPPEVLAPGVDSVAPPEKVAAEGEALTLEPWRRTSILELQWAFSYPSGLLERTEGDEAAAHQSFAAADGAVEMRATVDTMAAVPELETAYAERSRELLAEGAGELRFGQMEANGYILSGRTPGGRLFAEITLFADGMRKRLHLEYDAALEMRMVPVAFRILRSVRG